MFDHANNFAGIGRGVCTILIIIHLSSQFQWRTTMNEGQIVDEKGPSNNHVSIGTPD